MDTDSFRQDTNDANDDANRHALLDNGDAADASP